jgi:serine/threonine-protein kinase RsbW
MVTDMTDMTLPAKLENLEAIQNFISGCAESHQWKPARIQQMQLASEEALVNIFCYSYPKEAPGDVTIKCRCDANNNFYVQFEDCGVPFNMLSIATPDTTLSLQDRKIGGLGIFFIRKMTDKVEYCRKDDKNILTLTWTYQN